MSDPEKHDVWKDYRDAGHDVESMIVPGSAYKCARCGSYMIDQSEDLVYGEMRPCRRANGEGRLMADPLTEIETLRTQLADAKDDSLRLHREKMVFFTENIDLRAANAELVAALDGIRKFGFRHPGHGYSCATLAEQALAKHDTPVTMTGRSVG